MIDFMELMQIFSVPRPNGSAAEKQTREALLDWLERHGVAYQLHTFRVYPYFFEAIGVWLIISRTILALAIWFRWGWPAFGIALVGILGGLLDVAMNFPLVTWLGARKGYNLLIQFEPYDPKREIILSAHYDSKTELMDHRKRLFFVMQIPLGILLSAILGVLGPLDRTLLDVESSWESMVFIVSILLSLYLLFLAWGLGLNLALGRLRHPSQGAVDNGAACAILLGLAKRLNNGELPVEETRITLALFTGEEVNMQGSRAYTLDRDWLLPAVALNLEVMGQNGDYVVWGMDGNSLKLVPTSTQVNQAIIAAVEETTGLPARLVGPVNSDGYSFLRIGIPASTIGTYDKLMKDRGFHLPSDNLERVVMARLPEAVEILVHFIREVNFKTIIMPKELGL